MFQSFWDRPDFSAVFVKLNLIPRSVLMLDRSFTGQGLLSQFPVLSLKVRNEGFALMNRRQLYPLQWL